MDKYPCESHYLEILKLCSHLNKSAQLLAFLCFYDVVVVLCMKAQEDYIRVFN